MISNQILPWGLFFLAVGFLPIVVLKLYAISLHSSNVKHRRQLYKELGIPNSEKRTIIGFFHPYCNAGGGGERVLWTTIAFLQRKDPHVISVVYTGDTDATKEDIIGKVKSRMNIVLDPSSLHLVFLESRRAVEDSSWPRFTLLGQSIGSMYLVWEAMSKLIPDVYIDTMGYAFTFHVVRWLGNIPVGAYVHYPTISTNMLERVKSRTQWHTNSDAIASSATLSSAKLIYYRIFMHYYAESLRQASFLMVNSSWTKNHVDSILNHHDTLLESFHACLPFVTINSLVWPAQALMQASIVYPSCDTEAMLGFPIEGREKVILSIAQFRPEKNHAAQIKALRELLQGHPEYAIGPNAVKLVLIGGCRNDEDRKRVDDLRRMAKELRVEESMEFVVNASFPSVLDWLSRASIGLNTMIDEHFGINVVEFMAAGVIPVVHASGGPCNDIVVPLNGQPTGYHATDPVTFAQAFHSVLSLPKEEELALRSRARTWAVHQFSPEEFEQSWEGSGWRRWVPSPQSS